MNEIDKLIRNKFKIRDDDTLPFKLGKGFDRYELVKFMNELGFKCGAEIGVLRGSFSKYLCKVIPGLKLKAIDPWIPFYDIGKDEIELYYKKAVQKLIPYGVEIIKKTSFEAVKEIADKSLDFIYIDENHSFDRVILNLTRWSKKVRSGGLFIGRDYSYNFPGYQVMLAVDTYTKVNNIFNWYITNERTPNYFWVVN